MGKTTILTLKFNMEFWIEFSKAIETLKMTTVFKKMDCETVVQ